MVKFSFDLDIVTPLFGGGFNPGSTAPEVRASSLRGSMRWWFRAMMGGVVGGEGEQLVEKVHDLEGRVFGGKDWRSRLSINVKHRGGRFPKPFSTRDFSRHRAIGYLAYGMEGSRQDPHQNPARCYIPPSDSAPGPNSPWSLELRIDDPNLAGVALGTLWLSSRLGGVGARVRRGFGGIELNLQDHFGSLGELEPLLDLFQFPLDSGSVIHELERGIELTWKAFERLAGTTSSIIGIPSFSILHPDMSEIYTVIPQRRETWQDVLNYLGENLRKSREDPSANASRVFETASGRTIPYRVSADYQNVKDVLIAASEGRQAEGDRTLKNAVFGLPVQYQFRSLGGRKFNQGSVQAINNKGGEPVAINRRASPLWLRVCPLRSEGFVGIVTVFKSEFLPEGSELSISNRGDQLAPRPHLKIEGWAPIERFLYSLKNKHMVDLKPGRE